MTARAPYKRIRPSFALRYGVRRSLVAFCGALLLAGSTMRAAEPEAPAPIRKLSGKHLTLHTDLATSSEVDGLPQFFDQAFPQWCQYFHIDAKKHQDWHVTGALMTSRERFEVLGMAPKDLPNFKNGYSLGDKLWLYDQTSPYYRRHLLLHEGTHAFMNTLVGGSGPPWYGEGMAELLATHQIKDGKLTLNYFPLAADEVPRLGRVEIVQKGVAEGKALSLGQVLAYDARAHLENDPYGWCWALAAFLDGHPQYRERFRELPKLVRRPNFAQQFRSIFQDDAAMLADEWRLLAANLEYGYDFERMKLDVTQTSPLPAGGAKITIAADRGWQPSGIRLEGGKSYRLAASGRYQVADQPRVWWCEPGGVTIRYYHGQPLGILLAAVRSDPFDPTEPGLVQPTAIGLQAALTPPSTGALYLRINDSAAELADNAGSLQVTVTPQ